MAHLRVIWPDVPPSPRGLTLRQAFEREIVPRRPFWSGRTAIEYASTVNLWEELTGDPPLAQVDDKMIAAFSAALSGRAGRQGEVVSRNTVRKHLRHLKALLRALGPRAMGGVGLLAEIPLIEAPRPARRVRPVFALEELRLLAGAGEAFRTEATAPVPAAVWWAALVVTLYNTAWRIGTALRARWEWVEGNWIAVPPEAVKRGETGRRWYLNSAAREALAGIRRESGPIFPWAATPMTLQRWRRRAAVWAGIPAGGEFGFHCIRRTALSQIALLNPLVARIVAGHAAGDVLAEHYITEAVIAETLERLPQPWEGCLV